MVGFIKLHQKNGIEIVLNADCILSIKDMRNDDAVMDLPAWHFTVIGMTDGSRFQVTETEEAILKAIQLLYG